MPHSHRGHQWLYAVSRALRWCTCHSAVAIVFAEVRATAESATATSSAAKATTEPYAATTTIASTQEASCDCAFFATASGHHGSQPTTAAS